MLLMFTVLCGPVHRSDSILEEHLLHTHCRQMGPNRRLGHQQQELGDSRERDVLHFHLNFINCCGWRSSRIKLTLVASLWLRSGRAFSTDVTFGFGDFLVRGMRGTSQLRHTSAIVAAKC